MFKILVVIDRKFREMLKWRRRNGKGKKSFPDWIGY